MFDSDVLIDTVKLDLIPEFEDVFKNVDKCIINSTKIEVLNTKNNVEFLKLSALIKGFWQLPMTIEDFVIADKLQPYNVHLNKCPDLGDYLLASKLFSFGSNNIFIITGNTQDYSGDLFSCLNTYDVYSNGSRKIWGLLRRNLKFNRVTKKLENFL